MSVRAPMLAKLRINERMLFWLDRLLITEDGCALWPKPSRGGYATAVIEGKSTLLHRLFFAQFRSSIPDGMQVHHTCRNKACLNPWHMELLTATEHRRLHYPERAAKLNQTRTHCKYGHPFDSPDSRHRCSICRKRQSREAWARRKLRLREAAA